MKKITRREALKSICGGIAGATVFGSYSCERNTILLPDEGNKIRKSQGNIQTNFSNSEINNAKTIINEYFSKSLNGDKLQNPGLLKDKVISSRENDSIIIAEDYKIERIYQIEDEVFIQINFKYIGIIRGIDFYPYNPKRGFDKYISVKYKINKVGNEVKIINYLPSITSPSAAVIRFNTILNNCISKYNQDNETYSYLQDIITRITNLVSNIESSS